MSELMSIQIVEMKKWFSDKVNEKNDGFVKDFFDEIMNESISESCINPITTVPGSSYTMENKLYVL